VTEKHKGIYILYACGGLEILTLNPKNKVLPCHIYDILTWGKKEMCSALSRCLSLCFVGPPSETSVASEVSPLVHIQRPAHTPRWAQRNQPTNRRRRGGRKRVTSRSSPAGPDGQRGCCPTRGAGGPNPPVRVYYTPMARHAFPGPGAPRGSLGPCTHGRGHERPARLRVSSHTRGVSPGHTPTHEQAWQ
jgi:hypothetical protein